MEQQNNIQEAEFIPSENIALNEREAGGFIYPKYNKPSQEAINELRRRKKRIRASWDAEPLNTTNQEEEETALSFLSWNCNAKTREGDILKTIEKLKELQLKKGITDFSREFLSNMLKQYTALKDVTIYKKTEEILSRAVVKKERQIRKYKTHYSGCYITQKEPYFKEEVFYSFVDLNSSEVYKNSV